VRGEAPRADRSQDVGVRKFLWTWLAIAIAIGLTAWLLPGVKVNGGFFALLLIAAVFGLVNAVIGRILKLLTLPLTLMTLGLFSLVINALMLLLTAWWLDRLDVDGFLTALAATLLISLFSTIAQMIVLRGNRRN
jgi:putative membrane protein